VRVTDPRTWESGSASGFLSYMRDVRREVPGAVKAPCQLKLARES